MSSVTSSALAKNCLKLFFGPSLILPRMFLASSD